MIYSKGDAVSYHLFLLIASHFFVIFSVVSFVLPKENSGRKDFLLPNVLIDFFFY